MEIRTELSKDAEATARSIFNGAEEVTTDTLHPVQLADVVREALPDRVIYFVNVPAGDRF